MKLLEKESLENLPPADRGFLAWRFLVVIFLADALFWGPPLSFSVLLNYPPYTNMNPALAASTGTLCTGIMYCAGSILSPLLNKYRQLTVWGPRFGVVLCAGAFILSSYATQDWQLLLSQGVIYPGLLFLAEWWIERRGFAGAIMFAGASLFGLIYPPIMDWALGKYGMSVTIRAICVAWSICVVAILPFYHGRLPWSTRAKQNESRLMGYLTHPITWVLLASNSLAFFVPIIYLPPFAKAIGHSGGIYLGLFSGMSVVGGIVVGTMSDYFGVFWLIGITSVTSTASILLLWGFCNSITMLASFSIIYGLTAGGFSCLWQGFVKLIDPEDLNPGKLIVIFVTSRGIANLITGPITGTIFSHAKSEKSGYQKLIYFSGVLMALSTVGMTSWFMKPKARMA
ncbi:hypothetical protein CROQUDRAFT_672000 [Cronartium quercuum f. sp. fusiforme G11]|uniref:MFS general substrate transporter n=1 Tax=Cronartium quercuum f. sp. fusiforme G11 TaxID=708437 RepID=A0A9P6NJ03_9BASI|nr:hypothetical protein CROQUDRAFT_672000 [Cronartium quercuum f. sp. fusiforme G11]